MSLEEEMTGASAPTNTTVMRMKEQWREVETLVML
jgi:hypothetical protein